MTITRSTSIALATCLVALVAIFFVWQRDSSYVREDAPPVWNNPFATTSIKAQGVYIYAPASSHVLYQRQPDKALPLASVTKILTAYVASTVLSDNDLITIETSDLAPEGDSGLNPGDIWTMADLRDIMLVASANDAAEALRRAVDEQLARTSSDTLITRMNATAQTLGLTSLQFQSVSGLDDEDVRATAYGSAHDIAFALAHVLRERSDIFESTRLAHITRGPQGGILRRYDNTNVSINDMPSIIASKTGYTLTAGGNVVAAFDAGLGSPIIIVILRSTDQESRFTDLTEAASKALQYINGTTYSGL